MDLTTEIRMLDQQISNLEAERRHLYIALLDEHRESYQRNVGRCFLTPSGEYVMIVGIPRVGPLLNSNDLSEHLYPCLRLAAKEDFDMLPAFWEDEAHTSNGSVFGQTSRSVGWTEITQDEFKKQLQFRIDMMWERLFPTQQEEQTSEDRV